MSSVPLRSLALCRWKLFIIDVLVGTTHTEPQLYRSLLPKPWQHFPAAIGKPWSLPRQEDCGVRRSEPCLGVS